MTVRRLPAVLLALALVASCSSDKKPTASPSPTTASPTPSPTSTPSPTPTALLSPLTGLPIDKQRPVLAVKVDNATRARPQWGLQYADVVYEEAVEGRTTRFLAIYSSKTAPEIGPIRSVRESDMPLLAAYGKVAFAFSGGNSGVLASVRQSGLYDVSRPKFPNDYALRAKRADARSYTASSTALLSHTPRADVARDVGFRFGPLSAAITRLGTAVSLRWSSFAHTQWKWDPTHGYYVRSMDGTRAMLRGGVPMTSPNVLIQYCSVRNSRYSDVHGVPSPYTTTTGRGNAVLLRDGHVIVGTWERKGLGATTFKDKSGAEMLFHPGPIWVMLAPNDLDAAVR